MFDAPLGVGYGTGMGGRFLLAVSSLAAGLACSASDDDLAPIASADVEARPLAPAAAPELVSFVDDATGFTTPDVHDYSREIVHFDSANSAMLSGDTGAAVSGWVVSGDDLSWSRSSIEFRVRFGTEAGERRAYFTETVAGTLCDLRLYGPDQLGISGTSEFPPNP